MKAPAAQSALGLARYGGWAWRRGEDAQALLDCLPEFMRDHGGDHESAVFSG
jgi:hypothetical protein